MPFPARRRGQRSRTPRPLRRATLTHACLLLALACAACAERPQPALPGQRPDILLIVAEDLSPRLGAYGDDVAHTPHIDGLAAEGTRFTRAFTTAGVCAPSRAAIAMGVHQNTWGAGHMRASAGGYLPVPPPEFTAFPELLRRAGYYTINSGKTDYQLSTSFGGAFGGPPSLWDEDGSDDWANRPPGAPFFSYLTLNESHESQVWPTWSMRSLISLMMLPIRVWNHWHWTHQTSPAEVKPPPYYPDTPTVRTDMVRHYNNLARVDARVGEILQRLEDDGLAERSVVIFTSDHGDGLPRAKRWPYDSGIHIPLIVRWPGMLPAGSLNPELVSGVDLAPTLLAIAGIPVPAHMQGRVFMGPERQPEPRYVYAARDRIDEQPDRVRALRDRRWKYIRNFHPDRPYVLDMSFRDHMPMMREMRELAEAGELQGAAALWFRAERDPEELYDTLEDPHEVRNLAADPRHADRLAEMRDALDEWLLESGDLGLVEESELARRFWPGGAQPSTPTPQLHVEERGRVAASHVTPGASIEIRLDDGPWRLYRQPVEASPGTLVEARATRYGWTTSELQELRVP